MAKPKETKEEGEFFVGIKYPNDVRRNILESQKGVINFLRRYDAIKDLRVKKVEKIEQLRHEVDEISKLVIKLRRDLPKAGLRQEKPAQDMKREEMPSKLSEVGKLEAELSYIEKKLKQLS